MCEGSGGGRRFHYAEIQTMTVYDLDRDQLHELKEHYMTELEDEGKFGEVVCNDPERVLTQFDLVCADELVSDEAICEVYAGTEFTNDDFFCTAGKED